MKLLKLSCVVTEVCTLLWQTTKSPGNCEGTPKVCIIAFCLSTSVQSYKISTSLIGKNKDVKAYRKNEEECIALLNRIMQIPIHLRTKTPVQQTSSLHAAGGQQGVHVCMKLQPDILCVYIYNYIYIYIFIFLYYTLLVVLPWPSFDRLSMTTHGWSISTKNELLCECSFVTDPGPACSTQLCTRT